mgnify:CR=1 FL=1
MDSALRPRDIQARVRAGESIEEVARAAGVPVERVEPFAAPVIAERQHVAGLALANPVRRRGETSSHRLLRTAATESLVARGVDPDDVTWDAALLGDRRWQVRAAFSRGEKTHDALFVYDLNGRFSVAGNDDARWMIGETTHTAPAAAPARPLPVDDELALVRAIQPDMDDDAEVNDAYVETELTEVDGVYDIIPGDDPEMDALYDMLASFDEDSVKIYAGLVSPLPADGPVVPDAVGVPSAETPPLPEGARVEPLYIPDDVAVRAADHEEPEASAVAEPEASAALEPEQPTLVDAGDEPAARKPAAKKTKRASVPSWDEIMFGSPRQGHDKK